VIMVSVVIGLVRQYVYKHRRLIEVKKLLGWSYQQMTLPFVWYGISLATIWRLIAMLIICFVLLWSSSTLLDVFGIDVMTVLRDDIVSITVVCLMQLLILWILMSIVWYYTVASHMRRY
jgi:cell division protein FtsX